MPYVAKNDETGRYWIVDRKKTRGVKFFPDDPAAKEEESVFVEEFDQIARPLPGQPDDYRLVREARYGDEF